MNYLNEIILNKFASYFSLQMMVGWINIQVIISKNTTEIMFLFEIQ
jgi:hypothetical protein